MSYNKKTYKALSDLSNAMYELLWAWDNDEDFSFVMDKCSESYPFHDSFDELCIKVEDWVDNIKSTINELKSWEGVYDKLMDSANDNKTRMKILDMVKKQLEEDEKYPCIGADEE